MNCPECNYELKSIINNLNVVLSNFIINANKDNKRNSPVHQDFYDFMLRWKLEAAECEKAKITSVDE
jgi:hypothetical protein